VSRKPNGALDEAVVVVTGSSSGIGAAIARGAAAAGARVVVNSRSSTAEGEALAAELPDAVYVQGNIAREDDCRRLVGETVARFGRLDHLVNNAGTTRVIAHADLDAVTDEDWQRILGTNLIGTWYLSRAALPHLRAAHGSILNVTSVAGVRPTGSSIPYAVSKAALNHLTLLLANVVGPEVRVNALAPGLIRTPWTADWTEIHRSVAERAPLRRAGEPEDIAAAALGLLLSPYTTGVVVLADGGLHLRS
jgi:ketoreductase RED2